jgi:hypothetical protein
MNSREGICLKENIHRDVNVTEADPAWRAAVVDGRVAPAL